MPAEAYTEVHNLLLTRRGLAFVSSAGEPLAEGCVRAVEIELASLGYALSSRLRARLARSSMEELAAFRAWTFAALLAHVGGDQKHEPLFRRFPEDVPGDTLALWWAKVLVHFLQAEGQPCLFCRRTATTHVLNPCRHVVCDRCFDGSSYSACPVCEHHVDRSSPFFQPAPEREPQQERILFKLLDLGEDPDAEARALFVSLAERTQALSPADREALTTIVKAYRAGVLDWLPGRIPVRENVALIFGALFRQFDPAVVLPFAARYMTTATDVLRFIAVLSGADGSLIRETRYVAVEWTDYPTRYWGRLAQMLGAVAEPQRQYISVPLDLCRFKTAKLPRPLRRALLCLLEGMDADRLVEDMLRHQSYWVWVGEFLHPHEYAKRFPNVAQAFQIVRKKAPDGTPAPRYHGWYGKLDRAIRAREINGMLAVLGERPGELARRLDHVLRLADNDAEGDRVAAAFMGKLADYATPVLVTLRSHLPARYAPAAVRVYWPRGRSALSVSSPDRRAVLPRRMIESLVAAIDSELLRRFAAKPAFADCLIDEGLRAVLAPFNERTASPSAISLPRGSRVAVPAGKLARLFLHWCQPPGGAATDLDLSIAFYDDRWRYVGVCSYYDLKVMGSSGELIAQSAGDMRDAPWPDGATEFVDFHRDHALLEGWRYAVMVVTHYGGMPFSLLERAFAGLMLRDDPGGRHFDPRTVEMKFKLDGHEGIALPLVLDIRDGWLHWLDIHAKGQFQMNNVETTKSAIANMCPELIAYFASGVRASMFDLALLHAAARCRRVTIRGRGIAQFVRAPDEDREAFHARMTRTLPDAPQGEIPGPDGPPLLALLYRGDIDLPKGSAAYALFRERVTPSLAAGDLLS